MSKMYLWSGLCLKPHWDSLQRSPRCPSWWEGPGGDSCPSSRTLLPILASNFGPSCLRSAAPGQHKFLATLLKQQQQQQQHDKLIILHCITVCAISKCDRNEVVSKFIQRAMSEENHRIWGAEVGGWGPTKARRLIYREQFWVDGGNQIWRNCYECEEEESSRWWEQLQQSYKNRSMCGHVGQPTNYSLMNEVYETERRLMYQYRVKIGSRDSFQHRNTCAYTVRP